MKGVADYSLKILFLVVLAGSALAADDIPETHSKVALDDPEGYSFVTACEGPTIEKKQYKEAVESAKDNKNVTSRADDHTLPHVHYNSNGIYCVKHSPQGNPVLPLSVFNKTIDFSGITDAEKVALRSGLSKQLASTGIANVLVVHDNGNAYLVAYLFAQEKPGRVFYRRSFLKKGEYDRSDYGWVMDLGFSTVTNTTRGSAQYWEKSIYDE